MASHSEKMQAYRKILDNLQSLIKSEKPEEALREITRIDVDEPSIDALIHEEYTILKSQCFYQLKRWPDVVSIVTKLKDYLITMLSFDDYYMSMFYMKIDALNEMGSPILGLKEILEIIRFLDSDDAKFLKEASVLGRYLSKAHKMLRTGNSAGHSTHKICERCQRSRDNVVYEVCPRCKCANYCTSTCLKRHRKDHDADCLNVLRIIESDEKTLDPESLFNLPFLINSSSKDTISLEVMNRIITLPKYFLAFHPEYLFIIQRNLLALILNKGCPGKEAVAALDLLEAESSAPAREKCLMLKTRYLLRDGKYEEALTSILRIEDCHKTREYIPLPIVELLVTCYIENNLYQDAIDILRTVKFNRYSISCKIIEAELLYNMRYFIGADNLVDGLIDICNEDMDLKENYETQLANLKGRTARAMVNRKDTEFTRKNVPTVCGGCWKICPPDRVYWRCSGCHGIFYCGEECQNARWPRHKEFCKK
jgi:hypothetical protein